MLIICQIKILLIYQMKTVTFKNKNFVKLPNRLIFNFWLVFNLLICKMKTDNLLHKDFVNLSLIIYKRNQENSSFVCKFETFYQNLCKSFETLTLFKINNYDTKRMSKF